MTATLPASLKALIPIKDPNTESNVVLLNKR